MPPTASHYLHCLLPRLSPSLLHLLSMKFAIKTLTVACVLPFSHANAARPVSCSTRHLRNWMASSLPAPGTSSAAFVSPSRSHASSKHRHQRAFSLGTNCQSRHLSTKYAPIQIVSTFLVFASPDENDTSTETNDTKRTSIVSDAQSIATLVGAQGLLIPVSIALAKFFDLSNMGLGSSFCFGGSAFVEGVQWTFPLFALAGASSSNILFCYVQAVHLLTPTSYTLN